MSWLRGMTPIPFAATAPHQAARTDGVARVTDPARELPPAFAGSVTTNERAAA